MMFATAFIVALLAATASPPTCTHEQLRVTHGPMHGAAGTFGWALRFRNVSARACSLRGYPGVSDMSSKHGHRIGRPAERDPADPVRRIRLAPHGGVSSALYLHTDIGVLEPSGCHPEVARGLRIYPPNHTRWFYVRLRHRTCSTGPSVSRVRTVIAGATGA